MTPLRIRVRARKGEVEQIEILSPRVDPCAVFVGLYPEEAVTLAGRLFSLCPVAQATAVRAATGLPPQEDEAEKLLAERLGEMLRASLLDWPGAAPTHAEIAALRDALALLRRLPDAASADDLRDALARFGLGTKDGFVARQMAEAMADEFFMGLRPRRIEPLIAEDDPLIVDLLWADKTFSRAPRIGERRAETGAAARAGMASAALTARLAARETDMMATGRVLQWLLKGGPSLEDICTRGDGYAAVESARGRLLHACKLDGSGRISDYRIIAPTEWNFHPDGPFARLLIGAKVGEGLDAKRRVERLAFVFDPCIKAEAEILESVDA
ncbi:hypothetical protein M2323_000789 [Rhodoblastus acidophilus]|uniref:nickel-dependent hydrogenase large subunit n=1 Tax=Rhodoblastus acidophilus TaxID=1074 RepID=UPI002225468C|nr:nickel-dependent hydrogenase large subunit [Rhodoblastus acidophilus]MCW2283064.1 hypothetical protein [Rhodoblastus acidophilus]MCW2331885.1 hypothetical protein [Rhodoblastus acidophilus]